MSRLLSFRNLRTMHYGVIILLELGRRLGTTKLEYFKDVAAVF
jgi:hypothetical protein